MKNKKILSLILAIVCSILFFAIGIGLVVLLIKHTICVCILVVFGVMTYLLYDTFVDWFNEREREKVINEYKRYNDTIRKN